MYARITTQEREKGFVIKFFTDDDKIVEMYHVARVEVGDEIVKNIRSMVSRGESYYD